MDQTPTNQPLNPQLQKRVLIVEDEEFLRDLYVDILKGEGYIVDQAKDGDEALNLLLKGGYDLVLLDVILPKMDGFSILKKLAETKPQAPNKSIVCLTNLEQANSIAKGVELGIRGYLVKSDYTPNQLLNEIKRYLT